MSGEGSRVGAGWRSPLFPPSFPGHLFQARHGWSQGSTDLFHTGYLSPQMLPGHGAGESTLSPITDLGSSLSSALENCVVLVI